MLQRLFLALIVLMLALPAAAMSACHQPSVTVEAHSGHAAPADDPTADREHADALCIGCIAPSTVRAPTLANPSLPIAIDPVAVSTDGAPLGRAPPILRPPRAA